MLTVGMRCASIVPVDLTSGLTDSLRAGQSDFFTSMRGQTKLKYMDYSRVLAGPKFPPLACCALFGKKSCALLILYAKLTVMSVSRSSSAVVWTFTLNEGPGERILRG